MYYSLDLHVTNSPLVRKQYKSSIFSVFFIIIFSVFLFFSHYIFPPLPHHIQIKQTTCTRRYVHSVRRQRVFAYTLFWFRVECPPNMAPPLYGTHVSYVGRESTTTRIDNENTTKKNICIYTYVCECVFKK